MPDLPSMFEHQAEIADPEAGEALEALPTRRGLVLLATEDDRPIVLLPAADMRRRVANRFQDPDPADLPTKMPDLGRITRRLYWTRCGSHFETDLAYLETARRIWPARYASMVAWKPAWFVHVDLDETYPCFRRTRELWARPGTYLGPIASGAEAERFIDILNDLHDLCRTPSHLASAPDGPRCSYAQMGKCLSPCDGSISPQDYQAQVALAAQTARGNRDDIARRLSDTMTEAAGELAFERASAIKRRLDRLAALDAPAYRLAQPAEAFRYVLVLPGTSRKGVRWFGFARGRIAGPVKLDYPLVCERVASAMEAMGELSSLPLPEGPEDLRAAKLRTGLVARQLLSSKRRKGVMMRWDEQVQPGELIERVSANPEAVGVRRRATRASRNHAPGDGKPGPEASEPTSGRE